MCSVLLTRQQFSNKHTYVKETKIKTSSKAQKKKRHVFIYIHVMCSWVNILLACVHSIQLISSVRLVELLEFVWFDVWTSCQSTKFCWNIHIDIQSIDWIILRFLRIVVTASVCQAKVKQLNNQSVWTRAMDRRRRTRFDKSKWYLFESFIEFGLRNAPFFIPIRSLLHSVCNLFTDKCICIYSRSIVHADCVCTVRA